MTEQEIKQLILQAMKAREFAYAPYSNFLVGAALMTKEGKIFTGSNIENVSFGATNCAERTAFFTAVHNNCREFKGIAIIGGKEGEVVDFTYPCGICRQIMLEFCTSDFVVIVAKSEEEYICSNLEQLVPHGFSALE